MATRDELAALRPGAAVHVGGERFLIERTIRCDQDDGYAWWEHRLSSYRSVERSAAPKARRARLPRVRRGRPSRDQRGEGTVWEVSEGRAIDEASIEILA